jgi:hypothetical protein
VKFIDGEEIVMSQIEGGGQVSRRGFLRFLPAAVVGGSVLGAAKSDRSSPAEALEQAFLGGLLLYPNATGVYQPMPDWAFVAARNAKLWDAMRTSYLVGEGDIYPAIAERAVSDSTFGDLMGGSDYPTVVRSRGVGQERLPWLARELVDRVRRQQPSLPEIQFFDWWIRCKADL